MFSLLGARGSGVRGDFLLYLMSGIFLFLTHTKAMAAVVKAEGPTSPMMQHAPLNTAITISAAALAALYLQLLSLLVGAVPLPRARHAGRDRPAVAGAMGMLLLAWFTGRRPRAGVPVAEAVVSRPHDGRCLPSGRGPT